MARLTLPTLLLFGAALFGAAPCVAGTQPVASLDLPEKIDWYFISDIGLLHAYSDGSLYTLDLLDSGKQPYAPIALAGADEGGNITHVAGTNVLLVSSAHLESGSPGTGETGAGRGTSHWSYGIDALTGQILWKNGTLPLVAFALADVREGKALLRSMEPGTPEFIYRDLASGKRLWSVGADADHALLYGGYAWIVGATARIVDLRTGKLVHETKIPESQSLALYSGTEGAWLVAFRGKSAAGYELVLPEAPAPAQEMPAASPATVRRWSTALPPGAFNMCGPKIPGCGVFMQPSGRVLVRRLSSDALLDLRSGRTLWASDDGGSQHLWSMPCSPEGTRAVEVDGDEEESRVRFVDLASGRAEEAPLPLLSEGERFKGFFQPVGMWLGEDEVLVRGKIKGGEEAGTRWKVFDMLAGGRPAAWSVDLPDPPKFRLTTAEKGKIAGTVLLSVALIGVEVMAGSNWIVYPMPNLHTQHSPPRVSSGGGAADEELPPGASESARVALDRYQRIERMMSKPSDNIFLLGGSLDHYEIFWLDTKGGKAVPAATYDAPRVHHLEVLPAYGLAVTLENNEKTLRLLPLQREGGPPAAAGKP